MKWLFRRRLLPRDARRIPLERQVTLTFPGSTDPLLASTFNISLGGMFIKTPAPRPAGSTFQFECLLAYKSVRGKGKVLWSREQDEDPEHPAGMAVKFTKLGRESRKLIYQLVDSYVKQGGTPDMGSVPLEPAGAQLGLANGGPPPPPQAPPPAPGASPLNGVLSDLPGFEPLPPQPAAPSSPPSPLPQGPPHPLPSIPSPAPLGGASARRSGVRRFLLVAVLLVAAAGATAYFAPELVQPWLPWGKEAPSIAAEPTPAVEPPPESAPPESPDAAGPEPSEPSPEPDTRESGPQAPEPEAAAPVLTADGDVLPLEETPPPLEAEPEAQVAGDEESTLAEMAAATAPGPAPAPAGTPLTGIEEITWHRNGEGLEIVLTADGLFSADSYSNVRLEGESPRVLIRVYGVDHGYKQNLLRVASPEVRRIRTGYHVNPQGNQLHVVLDLTNERIRLTRIEEDGTHLRLHLRSN